MIDPKDIQTSDELDGLGNRVVRAGLKLTYRQILTARHEVNSYGGSAIDGVKPECQERIWNHVYGDLERKLDKLRRDVMTAMLPGAYHAVARAIAEVEAVVRNPFRAPRP